MTLRLGKWAKVVPREGQSQGRARGIERGKKSPWAEAVEIKKAAQLRSVFLRFSSWGPTGQVLASPPSVCLPLEPQPGEMDSGGGDGLKVNIHPHFPLSIRVTGAL